MKDKMRMFKYMSVAIAALSVLVASCSGSEDIKQTPDYVPVQTSRDGKWGMLNPEGKLLFADRFESEPSLALEGIFSVKEGETYNLYKAAPNPEKINKKPFVSVGNYVDGLVPASMKGERIKILDKSCNEVATLMPSEGKEWIKSDIAFHDGLLLVTTSDGKFGYVDKKGQTVIEAQYDAALPFAFGHAMVAEVSNPSDPAASLSVSIINTSGKKVLEVEPRYTVVDLDLENRRLIVNDINGHLGFLDFKGEYEPIPVTVKNIGQILDGVFVYANANGLCGVMDFKYKVIIDAKYQHAEIVDKSKFIVTTGPEWSLIDASGKDLAKFGPATLVGYLKGFGYMAYDKVTSRLLGEDGKPKGNLTLFGVGLNASACSSVRSDYQSSERIANALATIPSPAGVAHIPWGTSAEKIAPVADNASGIYAALPNAAVAGVDYLLNAVGVFSAPIGKISNVEGEGYVLNPEAQLCGVDYYLRTESNFPGSFISDVKKAFEAKGFKLTKSEVTPGKGECFVLESNLTAAIFCIPFKGSDANFFIYSKGNPELGQRWYALLSAAAADGGVPMAESLFGKPTMPENVPANYVDRSSRDSIPGTVDSGEKVSTRQ
ncbi:MAG: WG repeat-containing protein [Prevotella sp.]|nr:WG repeat-containing protein [Bacteroides sp.]MCM1367183.1 WG repeat-containing protein [Prevotella sp.]